jgi:hypothetical protein
MAEWYRLIPALRIFAPGNTFICVVPSRQEPEKQVAKAPGPQRGLQPGWGSAFAIKYSNSLYCRGNHDIKW